MLKIWFGEKKSAILDTSLYFKYQKNPKWLVDKMTKEMIRDIDKSNVINEYTIDSPVFGQIPPDRLSAGVKTLILIKNIPNKIFNASNCGDNCAKWLLKIAEKKDITINLYHTMNFGEKKFKIKVLNGSSRIVENMDELIILAHKYLIEEA